MRSARLLALVAGLALLGAPLGVLWVHLAPTADVRVEEGEPATIEVGEALIGSDTTLLVLVAVPALVVGVLVGRRGTRDGPAVPLALALGGGLLALVAWQVGNVVGVDRGERVVAAAADGTLVAVNLELRAYSVLVAAPLAAVLGHLVLALAGEPRDDAEPAEP